MMTATEYDLWEKKFLIKMEEDKELRFLFDAVQELMRDIAIELPSIICPFEYPRDDTARNN